MITHVDESLLGVSSLVDNSLRYDSGHQNETKSAIKHVLPDFIFSLNDFYYLKNGLTNYIVILHDEEFLNKLYIFIFFQITVIKENL